MRGTDIKRWLNIGRWGWALLFTLSVNSTWASQCHADPKLAYFALIAKESAQKVMSERININTATAGELATLTGVGAKTAQAIINYRELMGRFDSVDDLTKVKGIGAKTLEKNRHKLTVY
ncbi:ComEA family DNA-binding protein [Moraxella nonliquefaciens]|uniref:ComEA family DNA-binding protein n=1 Tax=Moraxella nonliquefaciens TaxID=478 RepID=A0A1B8QN13_MORNO|nr:ComEA family DNA-binding protein [Moraxella nonliquefaciens]OBX85460.1 hypothetical protein A7456_10060 [Moraxella nonliquefaciens]QPT44710.1 ComEA family DNA-binding protein [Moraxella nonliquefaciens]QQC29730.1 ComEA family DNA-binding protein [Moraxella nonliquefaciens]